MGKCELCFKKTTIYNDTIYGKFYVCKKCERKSKIMTIEQKIKATEERLGMPLTDMEYLTFQLNCMNNPNKKCTGDDGKGGHSGLKKCGYKQLSIKGFGSGIHYSTHTSRSGPPKVVKIVGEIGGED